MFMREHKTRAGGPTEEQSFLRLLQAADDKQGRLNQAASDEGEYWKAIERSGIGGE